MKGGYEIYSTVISFLSFVSAGAHKVPLLDVNSCTFWVKVAEFELEGEGGGGDKSASPPVHRPHVFYASDIRRRRCTRFLRY